MIAATAIAEGLPLYTTNPAGFTGLDTLIRIIPHPGTAWLECPMMGGG
jgi:hypothetical protein